MLIDRYSNSSRWLLHLVIMAVVGLFMSGLPIIDGFPTTTWMHPRHRTIPLSSPSSSSFERTRRTPTRPRWILHSVASDDDSDDNNNGMLDRNKRGVTEIPRDESYNEEWGVIELAPKDPTLIYNFTSDHEETKLEQERMVERLNTEVGIGDAANSNSPGPDDDGDGFNFMLEDPEGFGVLPQQQQQQQQQQPSMTEEEMEAWAEKIVESLRPADWDPWNPGPWKEGLDGYRPPDAWEIELEDDENHASFFEYNRFYGGIDHDNDVTLNGPEPNTVALYGNPRVSPDTTAAAIMLEEVCEAFGEEFTALAMIPRDLLFKKDVVKFNPVAELPFLVDYSRCSRPDDDKQQQASSQEEPQRVFTAGSILYYLAEKHNGFLLPNDLGTRTEVMSWLFTNVMQNPYVGDAGLRFHLSGHPGNPPIFIKNSIDRYTIVVKRMMDTLNRHLCDKDYIAGDEYTIADIQHLAWMDVLLHQRFLNGPSYVHLNRWYSKLKAERPAVQRGLKCLSLLKGGIPVRYHKSDYDKYGYSDEQGLVGPEATPFWY